jgi:phthiocerol/phenolphthiocerol synthesis type-I polyketide synthase E
MTMRISPDIAMPLPNGLTCYVASKRQELGTRYIIWEIFQKRRYFHPGFELKPGDTVVDIGGNLGLFVLWAAPQIGDGRIVTIEPDPEALRCLHTNIEANGLTNVTVMEEAVGLPDSTLELESYAGAEGLTHDAAHRQVWFTRLLMKLGRYERVTTIAKQRSLGQIMDEQSVSHVDFLKIDCEGGEYNILRNVSRDELARVDKIAIEYHEFGPSHHHEELTLILRDAGFAVERQAPWMERLFARTGAIWAKRA